MGMKKHELKGIIKKKLQKFLADIKEFEGEEWIDIEYRENKDGLYFIKLEFDPSISPELTCPYCKMLVSDCDCKANKQKETEEEEKN